MRRHLTYAWIVLLLVGLALAWWRYEPRPSPTKGTAATVAELKEQIPLDDYFTDLPEVGPFHWETESGKFYIVKGKAKDPKKILAWAEPFEKEKYYDMIDTENVRNVIERYSMCGHFLLIRSDGSFKFAFDNPQCGEEPEGS